MANKQDFAPFILLRRIEQLTELRVFIVGGFVRDILLGYPPMDADYLLYGDDAINKFLLYFPEAFLVNKKHRVYRFKKYDVSFTHNQNTVELEEYGRLAPREDLLERDYTINTIMADSLGYYTDYFGGMEDLKNKKLKPVRLENILQAGIRVIRGCRIAASRELELCLAPKDILKTDFSGVKEENFLYEFKKAEAEGVATRFVQLLIEKGIAKKIDQKYEKIFQILRTNSTP